MMITPMPAFSAARTVALAVEFEVALSRSLAECDCCTNASAEAIVASTLEAPPEPGPMIEAARHAGTLAIPLVAHMKAAAERTLAGSADAVHKGATSQDVADTVLVMQVREALGVLQPLAEQLARHLRDLAKTGEAIPMTGRTLLQPGEAITFGYKAAQWLAGVADAQLRVEAEARRGLVLQLGGAVGTLAALEGKGAAVASALGRLLGLPVPVAPWHSRRGNLAAFGAAIGIYCGALGKLANDIALLAQAEVSEAFEPRVEGRGGSSVMTYKRNATGCQQALTAIGPVAGLVTTLITQLPLEHERGLYGWQGTGEILSQMLERTHAALLALLPVVAGLEIDHQQMIQAMGGRHDTGEAARLTRAILDTFPGN